MRVGDNFRQKSIRANFSLSVFLFLCLSFSACERRELTYYEVSEISIHADWSQSGLDEEESNYGATLVFYPRGGGEPKVFLLGNRSGGVIRLPEGVYDAVLFNRSFNDFSNIAFRGAIGIFAIRGIGTAGATLIDGTSNLKLVCTTAADGTPDWAPASGDTHVLYSYDETLTYVAYYPYRDGITINPAGTADEITQALADNTALQPAADQSTPTAYTGSDLMTAVATPAADPANANKKVLTLAFEHQHALLVLKTNRLFNCTPPAGAGFEYSDPMLGADATAKDAVINGIQALPMGDGTFRAIVKTTSEEVIPTGSYKTTGDKSVLYTGTTLAVATLTAGKYYTQQVNMLESPMESVIRPLQEGDFFCSNGKISPYEANSFSSSVIGVVFYVGRHPEDNGTYVDKNGNPMEVHGYVINRSEGTDRWHNGGGTDFGTYKSTTDFNGYFNTEKLQAIVAGYNDMMNYVRSQTNSPQTTSGWFLPSIGQLIYIKNNYAQVVSKSFDKCGGAMGRGWQHYYWSSTEASAANSYYINWDSGGYSPKNKSSGAMVRTALAF